MDRDRERTGQYGQAHVLQQAPHPVARCTVRTLVMLRALFTAMVVRPTRGCTLALRQAHRQRSGRRCSCGIACRDGASEAARIPLIVSSCRRTVMRPRRQRKRVRAVRSEMQSSDLARKRSLGTTSPRQVRSATLDHRSIPSSSRSDSDHGQMDNRARVSPENHLTLSRAGQGAHRERSRRGVLV